MPRYLPAKAVLSLRPADHGIEFLAFHSNPIAALKELDAIDVELLQEGADADDVAFSPFFAKTSPISLPA